MTEHNRPEPLPPDTKDWTLVVRERCPECGMAAYEYSLAAAPAEVATALGAAIPLAGRGGLEGGDVDLPHVHHGRVHPAGHRGVRVLEEFD